MEDQNLPPIPAFKIPEDGKDCFQIGEYSFKIKKCNFSIAKMTHEFLTEIKAELVNPQKAIEKQLLDDYDKDGFVSLQFACLDIHKNGVPTGEFALEEDKTNGPYFYLRKEGFHYSMSYFGKITFQDGWIAYNGYLKPSYHDTPVYPVKIYKKFDYSKLNWREYYFSSMKETEGMADDVIQYLKLEKIESEKFPDKILKFRALKNLHFGNYQDYYNNTKAPLNNIPDAIGELSELQGLGIINCTISKLPESLGNLKKLENINVMNCQLKGFPDSIFQLPKLKYIFADNNKITSLPEVITAKKLSAISLDNNQLETLPEALAKLPKLNSLKIDNNPLKSLPVTFNKVKGLEMNIKDKRRLLDFEYRGADGKGVIQWDNSIFFAEPNHPLLGPIEEIITKNKLTKFQSDLLALGKKTIGFKQKQAENYEQIGNTRFGGMPDLPKSIEYPTFKYDYDGCTYKYEFIAQINCEEIAHLQDYLPRTGVLYFFLSSLQFFGVKDIFKLAQVLYFEGENHELISGKTLNFSNEDYYEMVGEGCYEAMQVSVDEMVTFPYFYFYHSNIHIFKGRAEKLENDLETDEKLIDEICDGFETPVQELNKADFEINGYFFTQHESPELQAALSKKGEPEDWITLLKVTSRGDFQWGDAGDLAFVIHKSDLLKKNFSNVFCTMESS